MKKYIVTLSSEQRKLIRDLLHKGSHLASVRNRAQVLDLSNKNLKDEEIKKVVGISLNAIHEIRRNFCLEGVERAVFGLKKSGRPPKFTTDDMAELAALACSKAPEGRSNWTLSLLKQHMSKEIGKSSVHLLLKKMAANHGDKKCGASGK